MEIGKIHLITFSPTQTSKQVGEAIVRGTGITEVIHQDLTHPERPLQEVPGDALAIVAVPVYGGRVAPLAIKRLEQLKGNNTPAILIVVYGNRAYEKALQELDAFVSQRGFKVIGAGTFIGEHSYSTECYPIATGRPDKEDITFAISFGEQIKKKIVEAVDLEHLYEVDVLKIPRPKQPVWPMLKFIHRIMKWKKQGTPLPRTPKVNADLCKHCGLCVSVCPNSAIEIGNECHTIVERCIKCCACVKSCTCQARTFDTPFAPLLAENFKKRKENKILL